MCRCKPSACILGCFVALCGTGPLAAFAQQGDLADIVRKNDFTPDDVQKLDGWITSRVSDLERGISGDRSRAHEKFVESLLQVKAQGSAPFKTVLAERCGTLFPEKIKSANGRLSYALLDGLTSLGHPATLPGLEQASTSPDAAVRLLAVRGVRRLAEAGPGVAPVPDAQIPPTVRWLTDLGAQEADQIVLQHTYATFAFSRALDQQAGGILEILEARQQALIAGRLAAEAADIVAFTRLARADSARGTPALATQLPDADQVRLVQTTAQFFAVYLDRLLKSDSLDGGDDLVRLVISCERLLAALTSTAGGVAQALAADEAEREQRIREAAAAWLGTSAKNGALNGGRWQVPVGGAPGLSFE